MCVPVPVATGNLVITAPWPGQIRTVHGGHQRVVDTYYATYKGIYFTGDGARRDADGYYWITGRVDDVMNISGHRLGTAQMESALVLHEAVAEAAVVGFPHEIKGEGIYAFVTLMAGVNESDALVDEFVQQMHTEIGPIARPDVIQLAPRLPKTRSGKIMRRIRARSPPEPSKISATRRPSPIQRWSTTWWRGDKCRREPNTPLSVVHPPAARQPSDLTTTQAGVY